MITILRRIRKSLIESGSGRKYLLYAIGEIALVVIGILIALQINNRNEASKEAEFEKKILTEMRASLKSDVRFFKEDLLRRVEIKKQAVQDLLDYLSTGSMDNDSLFHLNYGRSEFGIEFEFDKGAYESLKAAGLHKIRNDSLRFSIIKLYETEYPLINQYIDGRDLLQSTFAYEYENEYYKYSIKKNIEGNWIIEEQFDYSDFFNNWHFRQVIAIRYKQAINWRRNLRRAIRVSNWMIERLDKELESD